MTAAPPRSGRRWHDRMLFATAVAVNLALVYWPRAADGPGLPHLDKLAHAAVFAAVAWTGLRAGMRWTWLAALLTVHAVTSEVLQHTALPGRSGDPADVLADLVGVAGGLILGPWGHDRARADRGADREAARRHPGVG
ncbi:MAG: VanZ family protein [Actinomycetes bacterium]